MTYTIPVSARFHFLRGTDNMLNIHTPININKGDVLCIGGHNVMVAKITHQNKSTYYPPFNYFELNFQPVKPKSNAKK